MAGFVEIDEAAAAANTRHMADIFSQLLLERCLTEARTAVNYEGAAALEGAFRALGTVAALELGKDPAVNRAIGEFADHIDQDALGELFGVK